jgi:hypothetical protein
LRPQQGGALSELLTAGTGLLGLRQSPPCSRTSTIPSLYELVIEEHSPDHFDLFRTDQLYCIGAKGSQGRTATGAAAGFGEQGSVKVKEDEMLVQNRRKIQLKARKVQVRLTQQCLRD